MVIKIKDGIRNILKSILPPLFLLYIKNIDGAENIPNKGPFIVAANHASYIDHYLVASVLIIKKKLYLRYLAKKEHFDTWTQKTWHELAQAIPIDREKNWKIGLSKAVNELKKGAIIGIYPEGTRSLNGKIQRGKLGVARLVLSSNVPVLPIGLIGTHKILPKGRIFPRFKRAVVRIGKPIKFGRYYKKQEDLKVLKAITTKIMKEISNLIDQKYSYK